MKNQSAIGHMTALFTIIVWGTTFISTKVLLQDFEPVEILFFRFLIGLFALFIFYPHRLRNTSKKQEITFALAGLTGVCMYYLLENIALTYTLASNVGIIISIAPFSIVSIEEISLLPNLQAFRSGLQAFQWTTRLLHLHNEVHPQSSSLLPFSLKMLHLGCLLLR